MTERRRETLVIIGSGPAGWTAALYAARANLDPLVFEGEPVGTVLPGGQLMTTTEIENYPGFPEGITGAELMQRMKDQAVRFGARVLTENVQSINLRTHPFVVRSTYSGEVEALAVIIATGAQAKWLGVPNEERLAQTGGGVSACAVCDAALPQYRNQPVAVIGGGDSAMEEALYTTKFASKVYVVHRRDEFRASKVMADRVLAHPKIEVLWNKKPTEVLGMNEIKSIRLEDTKTGERSELVVGGMFVAIGHTPSTEFLKDRKSVV